MIEKVSIVEFAKRKRALPHRWPAVTAALVSICLSPAFQAQSVASSPPKDKFPTLTTALQVHSLSNQEAERAQPVHLRGIITYFDPNPDTGNTAIFVHDASGSVYVGVANKLAKDLFVGAFVDVRGVSARGRGAPIVVNPQIRVIGHSRLPSNPPRASLAVLKTGAYDGQWVEVEGSVHRLIEYPHNVTLRLELQDGPINVTVVKEPGATYSNLVDAEVRVHANAAPITNAASQIIGVQLQAPNLSAVQVVEPAPSDPFAHPYFPVGQLLQWEHFSTPMHRVHLRGSVILQWPGSLLCIRDATRAICAQTTQADPVALGDLVDLAGFVEIDNDAPTITDAVFRIAGTSRPVPHPPATADNILRGGLDSELIQIDGLLIGYDLTSSDATLQLSSGDAIFPAILPKRLAGSHASAWRIGSRLRITGVCSVTLDTQSNIRAGEAVTKSFRVLMRSPADVTLLEGPSWWTPAHLLILLVLALTVTLCILGWVVILRRRVELQADQLRESEQRFRHLAQHDSLTGLASRLVLKDRMKEAIERAKRRQTGLAVLMLDLDKFKDINDTFSHQAGDEVLRVTAQRLLDAVRTSDTVVRLGGDEFVVLLQEIRDPSAAKIVAATVISSLSLPVLFADREMPVSVSVGIGTTFSGEMDAEALLLQADVALYRAKGRGRHCCEVFAGELDE